MNYFYSIDKPELWNDISLMVEDNYASGYHDNDVLVMAVHHHQTINQIKNANPNHNKIIVYQLEPLVENHWWSVEYIISRIKEFDEVWDYDLDNIEILKSYGINAKFRPFVYSKSLKRIENKEEPDIDVLFYGTATEYRSKIIEKLTNCGLVDRKVVWCHTFTGSSLDEFIARSKIILDLQDNYQFKKTFDDFKQKQSRIFYALINDKCVVSEKSKRNYFGDLIIESEEKDLLETLENILENNKWKEYTNVSERFKDKNKPVIDKVFNVKNNNKIAIFYHLHQTRTWEKLFEEQMTSLKSSGLYDQCELIHIGINGNQPLPFVWDKMKVQYHEDMILEANTLKSLWEFANSNPDYKILYFHSKGVTWLNDPEMSVTTTSWRKYLEYFTIDTWKICIEDLNDYDCVGAEWIFKAKLWDSDLQKYVFNIIPHYAGNFWWANASYIKQLDIDYIFNPEKGWTRWKSEFWIGTKKPKYKSYHNSYKLLYGFNYTPDHYIKD